MLDVLLEKRKVETGEKPHWAFVLLEQTWPGLTNIQMFTD